MPKTLANVALTRYPGTGAPWSSKPTTGSGGGSYGGARYQPRYALPTGVTISSTTGLSVGYPAGMTGAADTSSSNVVTLTDQGSISANRTALQAAIDATVSGAVGTETTIRLPTVTTDWGDEISIPSATWGGKGLTITAVSPVRAAGKRVQDADLASMPKFVLRPSNAWFAPNAEGTADYRTCFRVQNNASNVQFVGLHFTVDTTHANVQTSLTGVTSNMASFLSGAGLIRTLGSTAATFSDRVIVDRCAFFGVDDRATFRGLVLNGTKMTLVNSRFRHWHKPTNDSQCFWSDAGGAGWVVENNYMAGAWGENMMFGGGGDKYDAGVPRLSEIQSDIVVRRNFFEFPAAYLARGYRHKNLFESKGGQYALFEGNLCRGFRLDNGNFSSQYFTLVFKYSTNAGYQWCVRLNKVEQSHGFILVEGMANFEAMHNLYDTTGVPEFSEVRAYTSQVSDVESPSTYLRAPDGFTLRYNTVDEGSGTSDEFRHWLYDAIDTSRTRTGWSIENNVVLQQDTVDIPGNFSTWYVHGYYGNAPTRSNAKTAWDGLTKAGCTFTGNHVSGLLAAQFSRAITGDSVYERQSDLNLGSDFASLGAPTEGLGCDITLLNAALAGVDTGL